MPARMAQVESAIRVVLAYHEALNQHNLEQMLEYVSEQCLFEPADSAILQGKSAISTYWQYQFSQQPQLHREAEEVFGQGMRCILRWRQGWRNQDGSITQQRGADIYQVQQGSIIQCLSYVKQPQV